MTASDPPIVATALERQAPREIAEFMHAWAARLGAGSALAAALEAWRVAQRG